MWDGIPPTHKETSFIPAGFNLTDVADLNFENLDLQHQMIDAMRYWVLEANVDGYRCDAADYVPFDFWQKGANSLRSIPNREIIMLAEEPELITLMDLT